jgi:hypothetical protein
LIAIPGVVGTAVGLTAARQPAIKIYTKTDRVAGLPANLEGIPVDVQVTGGLSAIAAQGNAVASSCDFGSCTPTAVWPTPVPIGVSTGVNALLQGNCTSGTIGARVKAGSTIYALSNNHIYARENTAALGTGVFQPGLAENAQCSTSGYNAIGTLSRFATIQFCSATCPDNTIDAAIAVSDATNLDNSTGPDGYGWPDATVMAATLGLNVQKYGRTSALTTGQVTGIDATVTVGYVTGTAQFVHQIIIGACPTPCGKPGDSGSLWVTNDANKSPVGLLFAGNQDGSVSIANRIGDVLAFFAVTVDNSPAPTASGGLTGSGGYYCSDAIKSVTASGTNTINLTDDCGNTGTMILSGATASGGLTGSGGYYCSDAIKSVTASGSKWISLQDDCANKGYIRLSF